MRKQKNLKTDFDFIASGIPAPKKVFIEAEKRNRERCGACHGTVFLMYKYFIEIVEMADRNVKIVGRDIT